MSEPSQIAPDFEAQHALEVARSHQNLPTAALAGFATASILAAAWAGITAATEYQIGFMAIAVGFLVGHAVRVAGHGVDVSFRVLGSLLALLGCAAGNLLAGCIFFARAQEVGVERVFEVLDADLAWNLMRAMSSPMDLVFYAIAVWEAWRLSVIGAIPDRAAAR